MKDKPEHSQYGWGSVALVMMLVCASVLCTAYTLGSGDSGNSIPVVIESGSGVETASYIIYKDGDYTCLKNGTSGRIEQRVANTSTVVQFALDQLVDGGHLHIRAGIYNITSRASPNSNTRISGEGDATKFYLDNAANCNFFYLGNESGITIQDMYFDGNADNQDDAAAGQIGGWHGDGLYFYRLSMVNIYATAIAMGSPNGTNPTTRIVDSCYFNTIGDVGRGKYSAGVWVQGEKAIVSNCHIIGTSDNAIGMGGVSNIIIKNNIVSECTHFLLESSSGTVASHDIIISDNLISNCSAGMIFYEYAPKAYNIKIDGNIFNDMTSASGIELRGPDNCSITNNIINNTTAYGISIWGSSENTIVSGNTIMNAGYDGIYLAGGGAQGTIISNNVIVDNGWRSPGIYNGIYISAAATKISIQSNSIYNKLTINQGYGIYDNGSTYSIIQSNDLRSGAIGNLYSSGTNSIIRDNNGAWTERAGVCTMLSGYHTIVVFPGMWKTPARVIVTGTTNYTSALWVTDILIDRFTVRCAIDVPVNTIIYWYAEVQQV